MARIEKLSELWRDTVTGALMRRVRKGFEPVAVSDVVAADPSTPLPGVLRYTKSGITLTRNEAGELVYTDAWTVFTVLVGARDDTTNWTFEVAVLPGYGASFGSGADRTRLSVTSWPLSGYATVTAKRSGYADVVYALPVQVEGEGGTLDQSLVNYAENVAPSNNVTGLAFDYEPNSDGSVDVPFSFSYTQGAVPAAGFLIFAKSGPQDPVQILSSDQAAKFIPASSNSGEQPYSSSLQALSVRYGGAGAIARVYHFAVVAVSQCAGGYIPCASGLVEVDGWTAKTFVATITDVAIKSYQGQGVNRRAIKIDAESIDWLDAPDTTPATDELLRARIGRLGVNGGVLLNGTFYSGINPGWSGQYTINGAISYSTHQIFRASGERRVLYLKNSGGLAERIMASGSNTWGSEQVINASGQSGIYFETLDGILHVLYFVNPSSWYIMDWNGGAWGSATLFKSNCSGSGSVAVMYDGTIRFVYSVSGGYGLYEYVYDGTSWADSGSIDTGLTDYGYPNYVVLNDGSLRIAYRIGNNIVERTFVGSAWSAYSIISTGASQASYVNTIEGRLLVFMRDSSTGYIKSLELVGSSWTNSENITTASCFYPYVVQLNDGSLSLICTNTSNYVVEQTIQYYGRIGTGIIERGSNSNGSYIKFGDGTMICWSILLGPFSGEATFTYPIEYYYHPAIALSGLMTSSWAGAAYGALPSSVAPLTTGQLYSVNLIQCYAIIIGRYKA